MVKSSCKVSTDKKYSERPSPPYPANDCKNEVLEGNDKNKYISVPDKNDVYRWKKVIFGSTAKQYYEQFPDHKEQAYDIKDIPQKIKMLKNELEKKNVYMEFVGWKGVGDFIDYAAKDATAKILKKKYVKDIMDNVVKEKMKGVKKTGRTTIESSRDLYMYDHISFLYTTDNRLYHASINGKLYIYNNILKKDVEFVYSKFKEIFGNRFSWSKKRRDAILIKLKKL